MSNPANVMQLVLAKYHAGTVAPLLARIVQLESALEGINRERAATLKRVLALEEQMENAVEIDGALTQQLAQLREELQRRLERGHRGAYQPGALYEAGDEVSRNGSTWRAKVDDPKEGPPGDGRSWVLVSQGYRRGANGKAQHENAG